MFETGDLVKSIKSRDDDFSVDAWGPAAAGFRESISKLDDASWEAITTEALRISKEAPVGPARRGGVSEFSDERAFLVECQEEVDDDGEEM